MPNDQEHLQPPPITGKARPERLFERLRARALAHDVPISAMLELTNRCHLQCRHCYIHAASPSDELSLSEYRTLLDQLATAGTLFLTITGGEPMVRPDFFEILESARQRGFSFILFTSGTRITPEAAGRLSDLCPQRVEISLLGGQPATHDRITRVQGSFAKVLDGVRLLRARGIPVQLKTTWMRDNIEEAGQIKSLARELDASFRSAFLLIHRRDGSPEPEDLSVTEAQLRALAATELAQTGTQAIPPPPPLLTDEQKQASSPCGAGQTSCTIDAHGLVYPCAAIRTVLGDIRQASFADIWNGNPVIAELRAIRVADLTQCSSCRLFLRCARCAGLARMETGSLFSPSRQSCRVAHALEGFFDEQRCELQ